MNEIKDHTFRPKTTSYGDTRQLVWFIGVLLTAHMLSGCGETHSTVEGVVTLNSQTLQQGTVTLHPVSQGQIAYGTIQADGRYLIDSTEGEALVPGKYTATVVSLTPSENADPHGLPTPGQHVTPIRYASQSTSDLHIEIQPGKNEVPLNLTSP